MISVKKNKPKKQSVEGLVSLSILSELLEQPNTFSKELLEQQEKELQILPVTDCLLYNVLHGQFS